MNSETFRFLWSVSKIEKAKIIALFILQAILGTTDVLYALFLREIINAAVATQKELFFKNCFMLGALVIIQIFLRATQRYLEESCRSNIENHFKGRLFSELLRRDYSSVTALHSGEWMNRLTNDTAYVAGGMAEILPGATGMLVKLISAVAMLVILEKRFLYVLVPSAIGLFLFSRLFRNHMKALHNKIQVLDGKVRIRLQDALGSHVIVRSYAAEETVKQDAANDMRAHRAIRMKRHIFSNLCNVCFVLVMEGAGVLCAFFCGYGILMGTVSYGTFTAVIQLVAQIQFPLANISGFLPRFYAMTASAERLMEVESLSDSLCSVKSLSEIKSIYNDSSVTIGLKNASFSYIAPVRELSDRNNEDRIEVLSNTSIEVKKGEYIGFVGPSGCGKSTILKLLMCLYNLDSGERYINYNNETKTLDGTYQRLFAYVPQGNHLMSGTIREIIAFADKAAMNDDARISNAIRLACADFISELDDGLDTLLGERGVGLSEGQMQRIAIARAIFSDCPILMLDEATSALDEETEKKLLSNLRSLTDKTVLIVTHRPAVLSICDRVITF